MPPPPLSWRALTPLLVLGASIAWAATESVRAQDAGRPGGRLAYEIQLDLTLNPARREEPAPPSAAEPSHQAPLGPDALVPDHAEPAPRTRVVHGIMAENGQWPSAVSLDILKEGATTGALCAGTVIDSHWVLTAAHCVFDRYRGGVGSLRAITAYTKSTVPHQGELRRVRSVLAHPMFAVLPRPGKLLPGLVNDIALLELEAPTTAPRQMLLASAGAPAALAAGTMATVVGWGLTTPRNPDERADLSQLSRVLLRADIPVVDRSACEAFLAFPGSLSSEPLFCAGDGKGGADACNGDSGGPIFVPGHAGEPLQAGIVSWGEGCARPDAYGAYTALPHFEPWIRERVPQAQWALPSDAAPTLAAIAGATSGGPAAPLGQVTADIQVHACGGDAAIAPPPGASRIAASRVKVGSCITVLVTSGATGHLAVFNRDLTTGETRQIFPNRLSGGRQVGAAPTSVRAGQVIRIPGDADGFNLRIAGPAGRNEIVAIVVPQGSGLGEITGPFESMRTIDNFQGVLAGIAARTRRVEIDPRAPRAVGTRQYDVVE
jgi:hypothetical protein